MSTNHTKNYNLCQWEAEDQVLRTEFNEDNAKLDAALTAQAAALKAETASREAMDRSLNASIARCGNCKIWTTTYAGDGTYGKDNPKRITFPGKPLLVCISEQRGGLYYLLAHGIAQAWGAAGGSSHWCDVSWSGNTLSLTSVDGGVRCMNGVGYTYLVVALLAADA